MGVDDIRHGVIADIPHMFNDRRSCQHAILVPQEKLQESIFLIRQRDFLSGPPDTVRSRV